MFSVLIPWLARCKLGRLRSALPPSSRLLRQSTTSDEKPAMCVRRVSKKIFCPLAELYVIAMLQDLPPRAFVLCHETDRSSMYLLGIGHLASQGFTRGSTFGDKCDAIPTPQPGLKCFHCPCGASSRRTDFAKMEDVDLCRS